MKPANRILAEYGTTIFEVMSRLARDHDAINLGQGFPEDPGPADVLERAVAALQSGSNQYPPMLGLPELRQAVAAHDRRFYGIAADWQSQVMVTSGATEALAVALIALIDPGDEVVVVEPAYDTYIPVIRLAGGVAKPVRLAPPDWRLPEAELRRAFSPRTKAIIFNSPMNPTGKLFSRPELDLIADLCRAHDCYAVCDEVYEHLVFDSAQHIPLITLPGMAERAIRVASAGKTFSLTGWKVGYITASAQLVERMGRAHQFLVFTTPPNLQSAVAYGLGKSDAYFSGLAQDMQKKRDHLAGGLARAGLEVLPCAGTYFLSVDIRSVGFNGDDEAFCRHITAEARVAAIPVSAFYSADAPRHYARFCFAKHDATLDLAVERLTHLFARG
jgi:aspartate/methionine/tyrosine aminotransferase